MAYPEGQFLEEDDIQKEKELLKVCPEEKNKDKNTDSLGKVGFYKECQRKLRFEY